MLPPIFWAEKIELLLLAAHLEGAGWRTALTVPPGGSLDDGLDWATVVMTALRLDRPLPKRGATERRLAYKETPPPEARERTVLRRGLRSILEDLVLLDRDYRYEGLFYDNPRHTDLLAIRDDERLAIEAKGVTGIEAISWSQARMDALALAMPPDAFVASHGRDYALLIPNDRHRAPRGGGFVHQIGRLVIDRQRTVFLVSEEGRITESDVATLALTDRE